MKQPPRIKLSALKHLVDTDMPAVIVVLLFLPGERAPHRSLLVPVDDQLMSDALHRVRREEAKGNRNIHRTTLPVPLDRAIELKPDGDGLGKALLGMVDGSPSAYIARKSRHRQTCGFDDGAVVGTCFVPGKDAREKISQLFLGSRRKLEVKDLTIERRRFGIALKSDVEHLQDVILEMDVPSLMPATIELEAETGNGLPSRLACLLLQRLGNPVERQSALPNHLIKCFEPSSCSEGACVHSSLIQNCSRIGRQAAIPAQLLGGSVAFDIADLTLDEVVQHLAAGNALQISGGADFSLPLQDSRAVLAFYNQNRQAYWNPDKDTNIQDGEIDRLLDALDKPAK